MLGQNCSLSTIFMTQFNTQGFPCGSAGKESACNAGDLGLIPGLGRSPGEGKGYPLQYSGLENSMDCIVHGVAKSQTRLSDFHFHFPVFLPEESHGQRSLAGYSPRGHDLATKPCFMQVSLQSIDS